MTPLPLETESGPRKLRVVYSRDMVAEETGSLSPSGRKPRLVADALRATGWPIEFVSPEEAPVDDLYRVHDRGYVDSVLDLRRANGFGSYSPEIARTLRFTCGAFHTAAALALATGLTASLTSGFHHAGTARARGFCTFNGLVASAARLLHEGRVDRIAILDCDFHYGDGTASMLDELSLESHVLHISLGGRYRGQEQSSAYLDGVRQACDRISSFSPEIVFYQAGVDVHVDDPLGGVLSTEQIRERDRTVFNWGVATKTPLTWNLAGGYQVAADGSIGPVTALHLNTFEEALIATRAIQPEEADRAVL